MISLFIHNRKGIVREMVCLLLYFRISIQFRCVFKNKFLGLHNSKCIYLGVLNLLNPLNMTMNNNSTIMEPDNRVRQRFVVAL